MFSLACRGQRPGTNILLLILVYVRFVAVSLFYLRKHSALSSLRASLTGEPCFLWKISPVLTLLVLQPYSFMQWPTYPVLAVLIITAIMQIIYLNVALQHFESRVVVPTQFVTFTISAITGSAILYRDFEDVVAGRVAAFCRVLCQAWTSEHA